MPAALKVALTRKAAELGFDLCRIARCEAPPHGEAFLRWLDDGQAGEMARWLEKSRAKRVAPDLVLPGARAVIVLALNYWQGNPETSSPAAEFVGGGGVALAPQSGAPDAAGPSGRIARYAWGEDYHDLIEEKLRALDAFLQEHGGRQRYYVDTGPVLERDFAAEAGIGWHGKSTMLIHPRLGTWFFLAELLTTLDLEPDAPHPDRCGACTRCLDACPTGAIARGAPRRLDARRCISYLTIELKEAIPLEFRPLLGDRIYGCDDCLEACPWNRFAQASRESAFQASRRTVGMTLRDYLALDDDGFRALFRGSPIKRIKRRGLLRNVCVALGNVGTAADLPALARAAADAEPLIAEHARWAIAQIEGRTATAAGAALPQPLSSFATAKAATEEGTITAAALRQPMCSPNHHD